MKNQRIKDHFINIYFDDEKRYLKKIKWFSILMLVLTLAAMIYWRGLYIGLIFLTHIVSLLIYYLIYKFLEKKYGKLWKLEYFAKLTEQAIINGIIPKIVKIFGITSIGKDSLGAFLARVIRKYLIKKNEKRLKKIQRILFMIDFDLMQEKMIQDKDSFFLTNREKFRIRAIQFLEQYHFFLKEKYQSYDLKSSKTRENFRDVDYETCLIMYLRIYVRIHFYENFLLTNQPFIEEIKKDGTILTAKVFSQDFLKIKHQEEVEDKKLKKKYREMIRFPFIESLVILETEVDAWWNNMDPKVRKHLEDSGIRNAKAFNRHLFGVDFFHIQIGQDKDRVNKQLRELDHGAIQIIHTERIYVEQHRIDRIEEKLEKLDKKMDKLKYRIKKRKFRFMKKYRKFKHNQKSVRSSKLANKQELLRENCFLKQLVCVTKTGAFENFESISLHDLIKKENFVANYKTHFYFKASDSWIYYSDTYMSAVGEKLYNFSDIDFKDIKNWGENLVLTEADAIEMNCPVLNELFKIKQKILTDKYNIEL